MITLSHPTDVIVIGGGAAGMIAAVTASEQGKSVLLLEKSDRPGRKILASGNGRCNLMNSGKLKYYGDSEFANCVLHQCPRQDIESFFFRYGLILREEEENRLYPATGQSVSVVSALKNAMNLRHVQMIMNCRVLSVDYHNHCFSVKTGMNDAYESDRLIIAGGGAVQPKLGGTTDGYALLEKLGHKIIDPVPALVPFNTDHKSISGLSGLRIRCSVRLMKDQHMIHAENGEVLFTDYGVSGICIMQCARFAAQPGMYLELDFLANTFPDGSKLRDEINRRKQFFSDCSPLWLMNGILPEKLAYAVLKQAGLPLRGETAGDTEEGLLDHIIETASHYRINIISNRGFDYAQVTAGGADCGQFDPSSMRSLIIPDLYAAGEVMNVDGDCGGFNLMFAFASGIIAGRNV